MIITYLNQICRKIYSHIKTHVFYKMFIITFFALSVIISLFSLVSIGFIKNYVTEIISKQSHILIEEKKSNVEDRFSEINNVIYQFFANKNIWDLFISYSNSSSDHFKMKDIILLFNDIRFGNDYIDSIYFYDQKHGYILSDAKYYQDSFSDSFPLTRQFDGNFLITGPRFIKGNKVFTYIRKFSITGSDNTGYFVININYNHFFSSLIQHELDSSTNIVILNDTCSPVYKSDDFPINISDYSPLVINSETYSKHTFEGNDWFITKSTSSDLNWTYLYVQNYSMLVKPIKTLENVLIYIQLVILVLSLFISYLLSMVLYKPLSVLLNNMRKYIDLDFDQSHTNEYHQLNMALQKMHNKSITLDKKYKMLYPYIKDSSIHHLLNKITFNTGEFLSILEMLNIKFCFSYYSTVILDFENCYITEKIKSTIEHFFNRYTHSIVFIQSQIEHNKMLIIINTENDIKTLYSILLKLKDYYNSIHESLTISLGKMFTELSDLPQSYQMTLLNLKNKFFIGNNEIIYTAVSLPEKETALCHSDITNDILNNIISYNINGAISALNKYTDILCKTINSIEYTKFIYFELCSRIFTCLSELGIKNDEPDLVHENIFNHINNAKTYLALIEYVKTIISESVDLVSTHKNKQHKELVDKVISYIRSNYSKDLSIDDISKKVFLSPQYLCSIFKKETGTTILDYITKTRMDSAKELLISTNMKIQDISLKVGYNTVQSFLRFFKIHFMMTPNQFRRKNSDLPGL